MQSCLGLYIENNIIKYAKTSKERETVKVESYGVKFYDDLEKAIKQIVTETFSFKTLLVGIPVKFQEKLSSNESLHRTKISLLYKTGKFTPVETL